MMKKQLFSSLPPGVKLQACVVSVCVLVSTVIIAACQHAAPVVHPPTPEAVEVAAATLGLSLGVMVGFFVALARPMTAVIAFAAIATVALECVFVFPPATIPAQLTPFLQWRPELAATLCFYLGVWRISSAFAHEGGSVQAVRGYPAQGRQP